MKITIRFSRRMERRIDKLRLMKDRKIHISSRTTSNELFNIHQPPTPQQTTKLKFSRIFLKSIYSEKATKFCEIFALLLTVCTAVKSKVKISQNFAAFLEYMNFTLEPYLGDEKHKNIFEKCFTINFPCFFFF